MLSAVAQALFSIVGSVLLCLVQVLVASLFACLIHEYGHLTVALIQGVQVKRLGWKGAGAYLERSHSQQVWREAAIILAGPIANLIAAQFSTPIPFWYATNVILGVSNLLPLLKGSDGLRLFHMIEVHTRIQRRLTLLTRSA